ncbi:pilus assembly protein TadG-related protein [Nocardiopsis terrae]
MSAPTAKPARRHRGGRSRADGGHASVFLILLMPLLGLVFALVWEGGQMLVAKAELMTLAHAAARAGTHQVDQITTLVEGTPVLDRQAAQGAAVEHLHSVGARGRAVAEADQVVVLAQMTYAPRLLPIGEREIEAQASATAHQP